MTTRAGGKVQGQKSPDNKLKRSEIEEKKKRIKQNNCKRLKKAIGRRNRIKEKLKGKEMEGNG